MKRNFALFALIFVIHNSERSSAADVGQNQFWKAKIFAVVVGQSNESGAGITPTKTRPPAPPMADPIPPHGGRRSWWPDMSTSLGQDQISFRVWDSAVGATSLARMWTGQPILWKPNVLVAQGSLILSAGTIWKCKRAPGGIAASTSPPSSAPASDKVEWLTLGPIPNSYRPMQVLKEGDLGFDPNGFLAEAYAGFVRAAPDEQKVAIISIGQGDKTFQVGRQEYREALQSTANFFLNRGITVIAGFTSPVATPGANWYSLQLLPGWSDFLNDNKSNSRVVKGANLTEFFGGSLSVLPVSGPGLQADRVHMNDAAYSAASIAWSNSIKDWVANGPR